MSTTTMTPLDYIALGWPVFPVHAISRDGRCTCGKADCSSPGKHPRTRNGCKDASLAEDLALSWWTDDGSVNIGMATGESSGTVVLDIDPRHGGDESLAALEAEHGELPETVEALTGGGGRHLVFRWPGHSVPNRANVADGVDFRADGGYVVAEPSNHASGGVYAWEVLHHPQEHELAEMPAWLLELAMGGGGTGRENGNPVGKAVKRADDLPEIIAAGARNTTLASLAGTMRRRGSTDDEILAALRATNDGRCRPPLPDADLGKIAASVARYEAAGLGRRESRTADMAAALVALDAIVGAEGGDPFEAKSRVVAVLDDPPRLAILSALRRGDPGAWEHRLERLPTKTLRAQLNRAVIGRARQLSDTGVLRTLSQEEDDPRPQISTSSGGERDHRSAAREALCALTARSSKSGDGVYRRGDIAIRVIGGSARALNAATMASALSDAALWTAVRGSGESQRTVEVYPPPQIAGSLVSIPPPGLPELRGLYRHPVAVVRPDGSVDPMAHTGFDPPSGVLVQTPSVRHSANATAARDWIDQEVFADFPWSGQAERAAAWALLLGPFLRPAIRGPVPMVLVEAPVPRSGKGLLVQTALGVALSPEHVALRPVGASRKGDDDEMRKRISAALLSGEEAVVFDNLRGKIESSALEAALTAPRWRDRILGKTAEIEVPVSCVWAATANNAEMTPDLARRIVRCRLNPPEEDPSTRAHFRHPRILEWLRQNHADALSAAWSCVLSWIQAGAPRSSLIFGGYESWASVTGGCLDHLGIEGLLSNRTEAIDQSSPEVAEERLFVRCWWDEHGSHHVSAKDLLIPAEAADLPLRGQDDTGKARSLAGVLTRMRDRTIAGYTIQRISRSRGCRWVWTLVEANSVSSPQVLAD